MDPGEEDLVPFEPHAELDDLVAWLDLEPHRSIADEHVFLRRKLQQHRRTAVVPKIGIKVRDK